MFWESSKDDVAALRERVEACRMLGKNFRAKR